MARKLEINRIGRSLKTKNKHIKLNCKHTQNIENYIYYASVSGCLFFCLCPINVKTAEPIGPKFCVGTHVTPKKVYEWSKCENIFFLKFFVVYIQTKKPGICTYFACLFICCLYPVNVKNDWTYHNLSDQIFLRDFTCMSLGKVYETSKFQNFNKIWMSSIFEKSTLYFYRIHEHFILFLFYNVHKEKMFTIKIEDGRKAPKKPCNFIIGMVYPIYQAYYAGCPNKHGK